MHAPASSGSSNCSRACAMDRPFDDIIPDVEVIDDREPWAASGVAAFPLVNVSAWHGRAVPARQWAVPDEIPLRTVTLFSGDGGGGKSTLAKQLLVGTVLGRHWLNAMPEPGPALYLNAEDEAD